MEINASSASTLKELSVFQKYYAKLCSTVTDINNLLKYFVSQRIINIDDEDEIKSVVIASEKVRKLLLHISGPLRANNTEGFYIMLDIMKEHGMRATQQLAYLLLTELESSDSSQTQVSNLDSPPAKRQKLKAKPLNTPEEASAEFGALLASIIVELKKNEGRNLEQLKTMLSTLTLKDDSKTLMFSDKELEAIENCSSIRVLLVQKLRHHYRWDDFSLLRVLLSNLQSENKCSEWLEMYEERLDCKMKLEYISEQCKIENRVFPDGYEKMVAIISNRNYYTITLEEYDELKHFVAKHCDIESYTMIPFLKASTSSLVLEWLISSTATLHAVKVASKNSELFFKEGFVYLRISANVIFDGRENFKECIQLLKAAGDGDLLIVEKLVTMKYIDVNTTDELKKSSLHFAAERGNVEMVNKLIKLGGNINAIDKCLWTPLHVAVVNGHVAVVKTLIELGANIDCTEEWNKTPLYCAAENGNVSMVVILAKLGANISVFDKHKWTPLHIAAQSGHVPVVETLIKFNADVNAVEEWKKTALHCAADKGDASVAEALIILGANINAGEKNKRTPLHYAAEYGHTSVVKTLIRYKADINAGDIGNVTPLHLSSQNGHISVVQLLTEAGANISAVEELNSTPLQWAVWYNQKNIVEYFIKEIKVDTTTLSQGMQEKITKMLTTQEYLIEKFNQLSVSNTQGFDSSGCYVSICSDGDTVAISD